MSIGGSSKSVFNGVPMLQSWLCKGWIICFLLLTNVLGTLTAQTEMETTDTATTESRIQMARRSALVFAICGIVFALLNLICCSISIHKAFRDRKAIIYRNAARRDAKKLENKEQKDPLLGHSKHLEPKLTSVVQNVMTLHQTDKHHADYEPLDMYYTADLEHPLSQHLEEPHDSVVHHYSRSPKLLRAKLSAEVHENDWAADDLTDTRISSGGNFSHLSAYPRGSKPPLANYDNL